MQQTKSLLTINPTIRLPIRSQRTRRLQRVVTRSIISPEMEAAAARLAAKPTNTLSPSTDTSPLSFVDEEGQRIHVMPADYGFRSGGSRLYQDEYASIPGSVVELAMENFKKEYRALRRTIRFNEIGKIFENFANPNKKKSQIQLVGGAIRSAMASMDDFLVEKEFLSQLDLPKDLRDPQLTPEQADVLEKLSKLTLDIKGIERKEHVRMEAFGQVNAPWFINGAYKVLCWVLDMIYEGRPIQRFWFLETVARMPYFSYISMLHLYESLGWWRAGAELRKVHFAEEWNELHHLQIMESLGGDQLWIDRFMAQHAAIFYYWLLVMVFLASPASSYAFSELIEGHAVDTYGQFADENKEILQTIPPPLVALNYYKGGDLYLFDQFQTGWEGVEPRRPACNNLYDVFCNIRDDEGEHVKTMHACKDNTIAIDLDNSERMKQMAEDEAVRSLSTMDWEDYNH